MRDMETGLPDFTPEEETRWRQLEAHGELLSSRLYRLFEKGYRPNTALWTYTFDLVHPNKRAVPVQLWPDGQLVDRFPTSVKDGERVIIGPDDEERFSRFLAHVPKPTALQRVRAKTLDDVFILALGLGLLAVFWIAMSTLGRWVWRVMQG